MSTIYSLAELGAKLTSVGRAMNRQYKMGNRPQLSQVDDYLAALHALISHEDYPSVYLSSQVGKMQPTRVLASSVVNLVVDLAERFASGGELTELEDTYSRAVSALANVHLGAHTGNKKVRYVKGVEQS